MRSVKESRDTLCRNLRLFRRIKGVTQENIASYIGVGRSTYAYYETGKTLPSVFQIDRIAVLYGVTINDLLAAYPDEAEAVRLLEKQNAPV